MNTVLIVEDNDEIATLLGDYLSHFGWEPDFAHQGEIAIKLAAQQSYDAVILDIMLPGMDGLKTCRKLRQELGFAQPILMLTARDAVPDRIAGLDVGADDYVVKPFDCAEVLARLKALQRRASHWSSRRRLAVANLVLDAETRRAERDGHSLHLAPAEFRMLAALMKAAPRVVSRQALAEAAGSEDHPVDDHSLRTHLYNLRKSMEKHGDRLVFTVRGQGYQLDARER